MKKHRSILAGSLILSTLLVSGCYSLRWTEGDELVPAAPEVAQIFEATGGTLTIDMVDPNDEYRLDPAEKDTLHAADADLLRFQQVDIELHRQMPVGTVLAKVRFFDRAGSVAEIDSVDLLRLTPKLDLEGELQYPELLLEEFTRYGVHFRREHDEFTMMTSDPRASEAADRTYRAVLANNCLDPTKWEMTLVSEDYGDFSERLDSNFNVNQNRVLAHSWFYLNRDLYEALIRVKNPRIGVDLKLLEQYDTLSRRAEEVVVDLDSLRTLGDLEPTELLELGHLTDRAVQPLDTEQYYKRKFGLFINEDQFQTYNDLLEGTVRLASYGNRGFYSVEEPKEFHYGWLNELDQVSIQSIEVNRSGTFVEIVLEGPSSPYVVKMGNVDLANLDEQRLFQYAFGFNVYPTSRRHSPAQSTLRYDQDLMPTDIKPYLVMIDRKTGRFVNNQIKGLDRIYLGWDSIEKDTLQLYLVSYERIIPVWMARVRLNDELVDRTRVRRSLFG